MNNVRPPARRLTGVVFLALLALAACSSKEEDEYKERSVEDLYNEAMDNIDQNQYTKAAKAFDEVERQHPYSVWATKAQLMGAYAQYERNKYDDAIVGLDRYIQLHPGNNDTPYAYYLKGLCYYEQIADVARDQKMTEQALKSLQEVVDRFPASPYARDAKLKVDLARDHMAGKEMAVGRYYQHNGEYLAAINRFKIVVDQYQTTTHVPEALHRLVEIYTALGMIGDAKRTAAVLGHNFPGSDWYEDSYTLIHNGRAASVKDEEAWYGWVPGLGGKKTDPMDNQPAPAAPAPAKGKDEAKGKSRGWFGWLW